MDAKKLLIVCDRDGKAGAQLLASLINAEGTVRGVPDPVNASVMDLYDWARVKPSDGYTLFFGDSDDLLLASDGIPFSFQHLGLRYGFIGTRALASVSLTDNVLNNHKDFLWYYRSVFPEARDLFASDAKGNSSLFDFIVPMSVVISTDIIKMRRSRVAVIAQKFECLARVLQKTLLADFLNGK